MGERRRLILESMGSGGWKRHIYHQERKTGLRPLGSMGVEARLICRGSDCPGAQPLRPVVAMPSTRYFCSVMNMITTGRIDRVDMANIAP